MLFAKTTNRDDSGERESALDLLHADASRHFFEPKGTVRCEGRPFFRTRSARDAACLADVDPAVARWSCLSIAVGRADRLHVPDLALEAADGSIELLDAHADEGPSLPPWVPEEVNRLGYGYRIVDTGSMRQGHRLENARELLRYAGWRVGLDARIRLIAALEDQGSLPVRSCMDVLGTRDAIAAIAALALRRFVDLELDEAPIGPETTVRPARSA